MENNFEFIIFSFFESNSLTAIKKAVKDIFSKDIQEGKAIFSSNKFRMSEFINPIIGGEHDDIFCFWKVQQYPSIIFFISNSADGRITLCNVLHSKLCCSFYQFAFSNNTETPFFLFHYTSKQGIDRNVLNYKDDKWLFYAKGPQNRIEEEDLYKRRKLRERLNKEILLQYLKKLGITFEDIDKNIIDYFIFKRVIKL